MAVGGKAVVFNPASVSDKTIKNYELNPKSANITSIVVKGEILNSLQETAGMNRHGRTIEIAPYKRQSGGVERHGMDFVEKSYEALQGKRPYDNRTFRQ